MNIFDYYTPEQQEILKQQMEKFSLEELKQLGNESNKIIAVLRPEMEKGTPIENPKVVQLSKRLKEIADRFAGSDPGIDQRRNVFLRITRTTKCTGWI
ncbi:hypothetical protein AB6A23_24445 [Paenibacillus tarimensis]